MPPRPTVRALAGALAAVALLLAACGDDEPEAAAAPPLVWTWVPIEGSVCSDGSPTGIGVERAPGAAPDVVVFLMGGGACWDALTCFPPRQLQPIARPGPYGEAELRAELAEILPGSLFDRTAPGNPYRDFTFVFVPYCTGDVHAGDRVQDYLGAPSRWHHRGRPNVARAFAYLGGALPAPSRVVVSGASAGGFGSLVAFDVAKATWPAARGYLVDDSGPLIDQIPPLTVAAWYAAWGLGEAIDDVCGPACDRSLAPLLPALAARHPTDRFALLSSTADEVIRGFFGTITLSPLGFEIMDQTRFERGVRDLAGAMEDDAPPGESHAFVVPGASHTMLGDPGSFSAGGTPLFEWLRQQVADDPAWSARVPPAP
jgi:hypothetical protein